MSTGTFHIGICYQKLPLDLLKTMHESKGKYTPEGNIVLAKTKLKPSFEKDFIQILTNKEFTTKYNIGETIGKGTYGVTKEISLTSDPGEKYIMKTFNRDRNPDYPAEKEEIIKLCYIQAN